MDPDIRESLREIKTDVNAGFSSVNKRIDDLVTKGEFVATVQRLDAQHGTLRRDFDAHEVRTEVIIAEYRRGDAAIAKKTENGIESVRKEVHQELEGFRVTTRWAVALAAALAGVIFTAANWLLGI